MANNTTVIGSEPYWANACVGENGLPGYKEYSKGYSQAANILIDTVLANRGEKYSIDEMVYPVCFNMRHSVELRLKGAILELAAIANFRNHHIVFDYAGSHDIGNIWVFFIDKARAIDERYEPIIEKLDKTITDIAKVDPTGQTFRYAIDNDNKKHLVDVALINFVVLKEAFGKLEKALDELHRLNMYLNSEYAQGSFTKRLSRNNLFEIASLLPHRSKWIEESFNDTKTMIKKRFNIGSKELSDSIKIIESHFELAPKINISIPLLGISETHIKDFFYHWFKLHDVPSDKAPITFEDSKLLKDDTLQKIIYDEEERNKVWKLSFPHLTPEKLAGISALFYFSDELYFSESYKEMYKLDLKEAKIAFEGGEEFVRNKYFHLFNKKNLAHNVLRSLYFLHKGNLADKIVSIHSLNNKFSWLNEARSRTTFKKPHYFGYTHS